MGATPTCAPLAVLVFDVRQRAAPVRAPVLTALGDLGDPRDLALLIMLLILSRFRALNAMIYWSVERRLRLETLNDLTGPYRDLTGTLQGP